MGFLLGGATDYAPRSGGATRWALQWLSAGWGLRRCSQLYGAPDWTQFSDKATSELCCWSETHDVLCNLVGSQAVF